MKLCKENNLSSKMSKHSNPIIITAVVSQLSVCNRKQYETLPSYIHHSCSGRGTNVFLGSPLLIIKGELNPSSYSSLLMVLQHGKLP